MTTKIIITPASQGATKTSQLAGAPRTVRVVTVGAPPAAGRSPQTKVMTVPLPATPAAGRGPVRAVFKRVYSGGSSDRATTALPLMPTPPRKRQRLDHLTADQKNQRRKLKNRVAAQTARDRKKLQMDLLESRVTSLERQNDELVQQNTFLQKQNELLTQQNALLLQRLEPAPAAAAPAAPPASVESAAGTGGGGAAEAAGGSRAARPQPAQLGRLPGGAGDGRRHSADFLDLLSQVILGDEEPAAGGAPPASPAVVGAAAEELEPHHDTLREVPADALLALLGSPDSPAAAVPESPRLSPEPDSPSLSPAPASPAESLEELDVKPQLDDLGRVKAEHDPLLNWSIFDEEPLDAQLDQFLLFPQLVL